MGTQKHPSRRFPKRGFLTLRLKRHPTSRREDVLLAIVVLGFVGALSICVVLLHRPIVTQLAPAELLSPRGDVRLLTKTFQDDQAHFYRYITANGREIRFFAVRTADAVVHTAFDTCEVCFRQRRGYRQTGNAMMCNSCRRAFPSQGIGLVKGGCNPAPLEQTVEGDEIVLKASNLELGVAFF